jgi:hypothetical protein
MVLSVADKVPNFDVTASCKAVAGFGLADSQNNPEACIHDEQAAHTEFEQKWTSFPAAERSRCVSETMIGNNPSYVEILTCLQMTQEADALKTPLLGGSKTKRGIK